MSSSAIRATGRRNRRVGRWPSAPLLQLVGADVAAFARGPLLPPLICALGPWAKMGEAGFRRDGVDRGATRKQGNRGVGPPCSPSSPSMGSAPTVSVPASGKGAPLREPKRLYPSDSASEVMWSSPPEAEWFSQRLSPRSRDWTGSRAPRLPRPRSSQGCRAGARRGHRRRRTSRRRAPRSRSAQRWSSAPT